jgi:carboxyl-terminal processing protease
MIDQYHSAADYAQHFNADDLWKGYEKETTDSVQPANWNANDKALVKLRMKALLARYKWRNTGFYEVLNEEDPALKKIKENN